MKELFEEGPLYFNFNQKKRIKKLITKMFSKKPLLLLEKNNLHKIKIDLVLEKVFLKTSSELLVLEKILFKISMVVLVLKIILEKSTMIVNP